MITGKLEEMIEADLITWHEDEQVRSEHVQHMGASGHNVSDPRRLDPGHDDNGREGKLLSSFRENTVNYCENNLLDMCLTCQVFHIQES